jgi:Cu/Ag efflux pump CusA
VPALASLLLKGNAKELNPWVMRQAEKIYAPILNVGLKYKGRRVGRRNYTPSLSQNSA